MQASVRITGKQRVKAMVALATMDESKRRRILQKMGRKAKTASNKHRRAQTDLIGKKWPSRKKGNKKMLSKMGRQLRIATTGKEARLYFKNAGVAMLAYAHQEGIGDNFDLKSPSDRKSNSESKKGDQKEESSNAEFSKPATKAQAKRLVDSGLFRIKKRRTRNGKTTNGGKGRIPSRKWVTENLTRGQAGSIIRKLGLTKGTKTRWHVPRPKRGWLGLTAEETREMSDFIIDEMAKQI